MPGMPGMPEQPSEATGPSPKIEEVD
jgi:hypothetical protein